MIGAKYELGGRKANLVTDYRLGTIKVKIQSGQACSLLSLSSLVSGKRRKTHSSFFLFPATETLPLAPDESRVSWWDFLGLWKIQSVLDCLQANDWGFLCQGLSPHPIDLNRLGFLA